MILGELFIHDLDCGQARKLLREWRWLLKDLSVRPVAMTIFGDWFLEERESGEIHFLDAGMGLLQKVAKDRKDMRAKCLQKKNQQRWMLRGQQRHLMQRGLRLGPGECFSWKVAPAAGGELDVDNLEISPIALHQVVHSKLTQRLSALPEGTQVEPELVEAAMDSAERAHAALLAEAPVSGRLMLVRAAAAAGFLAAIALMVF